MVQEQLQAAVQGAWGIRSAQAPLDGVPVANYEKGENKKGNHEQAGGFCRVNGVASVTGDGFGLTLPAHHGDIVRQNKNASSCYAMLVPLVMSGIHLGDIAGRLRFMFYALPLVAGH